jgi:YHS domain-containing protein/thioredoxin-related protein
MRAFIFALALAVTSTSLAGDEGWLQSYSEAKDVVENDGGAILIHFHAWYCGPCKQMDANVFSDAEVQKALRSGLAAIKVDTTHDPELAAKYGADTVPRDVVIFADGKFETLNVGYMSKSSYLNLLRETSDRASRIHVPKPVDTNRKDTVIDHPEKTDGTDVTKSDSSEASIDPALIGLDGFCPVRLHDKREWIPGKDKITADFRGIRYLFSSEASRDAFLKNPAVYAPQDLGCDPVILTKSQKAIAGSIRFGAFFDNRLYLFTTAENRDKFKAGPLEFTEIRSALRVDQVDGTSFQ